MKKIYNCPAVEVIRINAVYTICDGSSEKFSIVNPGTTVGANEGRAPRRSSPIPL